MMTFIIDPPAQPFLPIVGVDDQFPVGRIFCVGQNYADHVREMGGDPARGQPIFFDKPASALAASGSTLAFPPATNDLHHEIELAVALRSGGTNLDAASAISCILGYATALDMTRRDLQQKAKSAGKPWDMAKGFDQSAPCGALSLMPGRVLGEGGISLSINGQMRQSGDLNQMIWTVDEILVELSKLVSLQPGDLILTGTPAGVSRVQPDDILEGSITGLAPLTVTYQSNA
ncbi:MAG: fumarylacetoacetate hydrolase family protein [Devosiaceae bacterium]